MNGLKLLANNNDDSVDLSYMTRFTDDIRM